MIEIKLTKRYPHSRTEDIVDAYMRGWNDALASVMDYAPTVDPVKHGHWTDRAKSILGLPTEACSECVEWSVGYKKDYCPHCGAKMDEVQNE